MQKKLLCLLSAILLVFTSCSNDENADYASLILPKTITYKDGNNKIYQTATFDYNDNKIVSFSNGNVYIDFTYEGNKIVKEIRYANYGESCIEKLYNYSNGSLKTVMKSVNGKESKYVYINNGDRTIKKEIYKIDKEGKQSESYSIDMLTFEKGNIIKSVLHWAEGAYIDTYHYDYDTKKNAFKNILGLNLLLDQADFGSQLNFSSANNIKKYSISTSRNPEILPDPYEGIIFDPYAENSNYEYNKEGYPLKKTTFDYKGNITDIIEYTY